MLANPAASFAWHNAHVVHAALVGNNTTSAKENRKTEANKTDARIDEILLSPRRYGNILSPIAFRLREEANPSRFSLKGNK